MTGPSISLALPPAPPPGSMAEIEALEHVGRFDEAFARIVARNQAQAAAAPDLKVHEEALLKVAAVLRGWFTPAAFARGLKGNGTTWPIFVLGMPRTGSTLVEQILASHSKVQGMGENEGVLHRIVREEGSAIRPDRLVSGDLDRLVRTYLKRMRERGWTGDSKLVDKYPTNYLHVGLIRLAFPRAVILHTVRDPIDTCFACYRQAFAPEGVPYALDLAHVGAHYRGYREMMDHWARVTPGAVIEVAYEDLVADLDGQARRLLKACGLPWEDACLRFYETERVITTASRTQVRRPIYGEAMGRWKAYRQHLGPLIEALGPYAAASLAS